MSPVLLLLSFYIYCKAMDFELHHPKETLKDRVIYFVGCRAYEAIICCILKKNITNLLVHRIINF